MPEGWSRARLYWRARRDVRPPPHGEFGAFGLGSRIVPPARVSEPSCIYLGQNVLIGGGSWLSVVRTDPGKGPRLILGDGVRVGARTTIACIGEVIFEDGATCAEDVFVGDCYHGYQDPWNPVIYQPMSVPEPVRVRAGAYLGAGSLILPGVTVGLGAFVGEGAVVSADVPAGAVVYGNPARPLCETSTR